MTKKQGRCEIAMCRGESYLIWYGHEICKSCWDKHCDGILCLFDEFDIKEYDVRPKVTA